MLGSRTCFLTDGGKLINHCSARALSVTDAAFDALFAAVCAYSVHTHMGTLVEGFVTAPNGNRVGIAATAVEKDGTVTAIRDVQSLNIRIAREERGCARGVLNTLFVGRLPSIIVAAPPGGGKTTVRRVRRAVQKSEYRRRAGRIRWLFSWGEHRCAYRFL